MKARTLLISTGKGGQFGVLVVPGEERERDRRAGTPMSSWSPSSTAGGAGASSPRRPLGRISGRVAGQIGRDQLRVGRRRHDDVHLLKQS